MRLPFAYSASGHRRVQLDGGTNAPIYSYEYDQANRLTRFTKHSPSEVSGYSYNGDGLRFTKAYPGNLTLEMTWDVAAGLPLLLYDGNAAYIYGPGGMLLAQAVEGINGPGAPQQRGEAALTSEPLAHRIASGHRRVQLDGGTNAPIYSYEYDQANRLTSFTKHSTNEVSSYSYNGDGLRFTKPYPGNLTLEMT